jgi:hypothetical protein
MRMLSKQTAALVEGLRTATMISTATPSTRHDPPGPQPRTNAEQPARRELPVPPLGLHASDTGRDDHPSRCAPKPAADPGKEESQRGESDVLAGNQQPQCRRPGHPDDYSWDQESERHVGRVLFVEIETGCTLRRGLAISCRDAARHPLQIDRRRSRSGGLLAFHSRRVVPSRASGTARTTSALSRRRSCAITRHLIPKVDPQGRRNPGAGG